MAFAGLRGTGSWGTDERPKNFREMILWLNPNGSAPLTALLAKAKKESVNDPEFNWWEEKQSAIRVQINFTTGYSTTATSAVIVADALRLVKGDILLVEKTEDAAYTNEIIEIVNTPPNDTTIEFSRGAANTTAAPILNSVFLTKIGSVFEEGSAKAEKSTRNPTKLFNYCEIFKTGMGLTNTTKETFARTGDPWKNDKVRRSFDHSVDLESAFLFGKKYETTGVLGFPKRFTGGLRQFITTNVKIFTTTPTEDAFLDAVYKVWDYNTGAGNERIMLAGNGFLNSLNKLARNSASTRVNFDGTIKIYGMELQKWVLPQGTLGVKTHPLMNTHGRFTNSAFVIDPTGLIYRPLRDTKFEDKIQIPGTDAQEAQWITECGLEVHHEVTMAYIGNFVV
jgi:hypothetical protein